MFAALYRLLAHEESPSTASLQALGFKVDPQAADGSTLAAVDSHQKAGISTAGATSQRGTQGSVPDSSISENKPDWTFPLFIVRQRTPSESIDPGQHLAVQPFSDTDDEPLCAEPEMIPLLDRQTLSHRLLQAFTQATPSGRIDTRRLSERVASHRSLVPVPRRQRSLPVQQFWLLIDHLPGLAWDVDNLQQQFSALPLVQRPQRQFRLTDDASVWFDESDFMHASSSLPGKPEDMALLVVGDPQAPSRAMQGALRKLATPSTHIAWLSPEPHSRAIYWGKQPVTANSDDVVEQMKTLLWPMPVITPAMARTCRLALGGSVAAERAFWMSIAGGAAELLSEQCALRIDREHYSMRMSHRVAERPAKVQSLYRQLQPHIDAMSATFRHRVMLNLPDALVDSEKKAAAETFFASLAVGAKQANGQDNHRHLCAVILQMADGLVDKDNPSDRVKAAIQVGQQGYRRYDPNSAILAGAVSDGLDSNTTRGYIAATNNRFVFTSENQAGTLATLDCSRDGFAIETDGKRKLYGIGDPLPSIDFTLHTPAETLDIFQPVEQRFSFAESVWQDNAGVHLLTQDCLRIDYPTEGGGPVFDLNDTPEWMHDCQFGIDDYGLWADLEISGIMVKMRWIPPGRFQMGSPEDEAERSPDEQLHWVSLTQGYWLADTTCTQVLWEAVMGKNPSQFKGSQRPVESISWKEVQKFLEEAGKGAKPGLSLTLPTEAQWEYACRAGTSTAFSLGATISTDQVNYDGDNPYGDAPEGEYRKETVDVKAFSPNGWGLYQMHGNVLEWCRDWYGEYDLEEQIDPTGAETGEDRVLRGGGWFSDAQGCRSADRDWFGPSGRNLDIGLRFAQVTPASERRGAPASQPAGETEARRSRDSLGLAGRLRKIFTRKQGN